MVKNIHMAAYCLDIEFWDQQQSSTNIEAYQALKRVINKFKIFDDQEEHTEQDIINIRTDVIKECHTCRKKRGAYDALRY
jgi:hypothetical protein